MARDLDELRATLAKVPTRAPWSAYLRRNFTEFHAAISDGAKDWTAIAAWAGDITPAAARRAYDREYVRRYGKRRDAPVMAVASQPAGLMRPIAQPPSPVQMLDPEKPAVSAKDVLQKLREQMRKYG